MYIKIITDGYICKNIEDEDNNKVFVQYIIIPSEKVFDIHIS